MCLCVASLTAKVIHQSPCQSEAHAAALDMKKPAHMHMHAAPTETHKYNLMPVLGWWSHWMDKCYLKRPPLGLRKWSESGSVQPQWKLDLPYWTLHSFESSWYKTDKVCGQPTKNNEIYCPAPATLSSSFLLTFSNWFLPSSLCDTVFFSPVSKINLYCVVQGFKWYWSLENETITPCTCRFGGLLQNVHSLLLHRQLCVKEGWVMGSHVLVNCVLAGGILMQEGREIR